MRTHVAAAILSLSAIPAAADEPALVTDRPDFTESAVVVPQWSVQVEGGVTWERGGDDIDLFSGPELLVRWTPIPGLELRLGAPDYVIVGEPVDESGFGDSSVGVKIEINPLVDIGWDTAAIVSVSLPTGDDDFTSSEADPSAIITAGRAIGSNWSVGAQIQGEWRSAGGNRKLTRGGTVVVARSLTDELNAFLEVAVASPEDGDVSTVLHHGYTVLISPLFQLDVHGGVGLSDAAPNAFLGAGFALRL